MVNYMVKNTTLMVNYKGNYQRIGSWYLSIQFLPHLASSVEAEEITFPTLLRSASGVGGRDRGKGI